MAAHRAHQDLVDHADAPAAGNAQVVFDVLGGAQRFVEAADVLEHRAPHHHRRRHQRRVVQDPAQHPAVLGDHVAPAEHVDRAPFPVDPCNVAQDHAGLGVGLEPGELQRGFFREPLIVAVEQGDVPARGEPHAVVARRRHAGVGLPHMAHPVAEARLQRGTGMVGGAVVHHQDLVDGACLRQHRVDRPAYQLAAVERRYDHRNQG